MILTMDIGNTNIKTALFDGKEMYKYWRMSTSTTSTSDEYGVRLSSMFAHEGVPTSVVDGIVVSSTDDQFHHRPHAAELLRQGAAVCGPRGENGYQYPL